MKKSTSQSQFLFGLLILVMGVIALINSLNILQLRNVFHFWPTAFIVFGLFKLSQSATGKQRIWAGFFIALGSLMTLSNMGIIHFNIRDWWPVILIIVGIKMIMSDKLKFNLSAVECVPDKDISDQHIDLVAVLGASIGNVKSQNFRSGNITAFMGGVELDMQQANIVDTATLDITCVMGGAVLKIPRDWVVVNQAFSFMGGIEDKSIPSADATKKLIITGSAFMGGIEIKNA